MRALRLVAREGPERKNKGRKLMCVIVAMDLFAPTVLCST
ncbi:hypothetical protein BpOF4_21239 (plasmid) [Alkalihalophilus pseudofirmus OF4]|uniref:Uncharacterized protein n=1 Tax=Alkalihalophilus pseudofirmus (strain ATCC BAA-2126 / JCM 17055 / OF4) TaxID=398511 RepID=D3G1L7_ALKPO|nr:hypothetical protein BpOF4_21239 [Alkalihalophilus pseudofirmus OF4]